MEHAFAEERGAERQAIEAADQDAVPAAFDRVDEAGVEQFAIQPPNRRIDPRRSACAACMRAALDHRVEVAVDGYFEPIGSHGLRQASRNFQPIERKDAALLRLDPIEPIIVLVLAHWKKADRIGAQNDVRRDLGAGRNARHGFECWVRPPRGSRSALDILASGSPETALRPRDRFLRGREVSRAPLARAA